eukprot:CAMPEP_0177614946 /NCGR_PEP_ID=MMETSP0419_2-20121207/23084_1 /TAXON_ID=582737 /ORGANISM="Tetraselmis sp., Strain GSL018" /LENGTH=53 /DNA_ID=CAMNT_0019112353 /DNA_START=22 /DNA_END=180 /DNA_ORIENTATION=-
MLNSLMSESILCPEPDTGEACAIWRKHRIQEFLKKANELGVENSPDFQVLLQK